MRQATGTAHRPGRRLLAQVGTRPARLGVTSVVLSLLALGGVAAFQHGGTADSHAGEKRPGAHGTGLILRPQAASFSGTLSGGAGISGTITPGLPGPNTLRLKVQLPAGRAAQGGRVLLVLSMQGMAMTPVHAALQTQGQGHYAGTIQVPMFGSYRAQVEAVVAGHRYGGTLTVSMPLRLASLSTHTH